VSDSDSVLVIGSNNGGHAFLEKVEMGGNPMGIAVNPETNMIYVANYVGDSISVIDGKTSKVILTPWSVWQEIVAYSAIGGTAALILFNRRNRFQRAR
jgi:DNA-binding beta-propeller fold protein YncE